MPPANLNHLFVQLESILNIYFVLAWLGFDDGRYLITAVLCQSRERNLNEYSIWFNTVRM